MGSRGLVLDDAGRAIVDNVGNSLIERVREVFALRVDRSPFPTLKTNSVEEEEASNRRLTLTR